MKDPSLTNCQVPDCRVCATVGTVLGTHFFCMELLTDKAAIPASLLRLNVCPGHLTDIRRMFAEIDHDPQLRDYSDVGAFVQN